MKEYILVLLLLTPIVCTKLNLYHDEIQNEDLNNDDNDEKEILNENNDDDYENTGEAEEINDVLQGEVEKYVIRKLATSKYLDHYNDIDDLAADPLKDATQNDEDQLFQQLSNNDLDGNGIPPDENDSEDDDDNDDDGSANGRDGNASDKKDISSPIEIDEKLDGKVVNKKGQMILQGDILMTKAEERKYFGSAKSDEENDEIEQDISKGVNYWPNGVVPYVIESSLQGGWFISNKIDARKAIDAAKAEFNEKTCIRLIPRTSQTNYVSFFSGSGCYSQVGMRGNKQQISLGPGCGHKKTAIHEVMHALGFWHEQSRPDRNSYVTINTNNIEKGKEHNFAMYTWSQTETFGHPYDYRSVMHYPKNAFGKKNWIGVRAETITPKRKTDLGQCNSCGMTETDNAQIIRLYCSKEQTRVPSYAVLANELKMMMAAFRGQSNAIFRRTLLEHLRRRYPGYDWTVSSYNAVGGYDKHAFRGYCGHVWRYHNKNVVACYSRKGVRIPSVAKRNEIANAVINSVKDKGCYAKSVRDIAWNKATSYGYPIAMVHSVRHGSGLQVQWHAVTNFWNYRCQRECKHQGWWLGRKYVCTNHMSSLVLMFGGP